jgi:clan AA aspartic protease
MIHGTVNESGCAMIRLDLRSSPDSDTHETGAWIDTGFTGELALPKDLIREMSLPAGGLVRAILADGSETKAITYLAHLDWFGEERPVEVVAIDGSIPLLGVMLLLGRCLKVDYAAMNLSIE